MAAMLVLYATAEGQTRKIAEHITDIARRKGHVVGVQDIRLLSDGFELDTFDAVILGGSIHGGKYPHYLVNFVKQHRGYLTTTPSAFFSVCLTAAKPTAENMAQARKYVEDFKRATGWEPASVGIFGGALRYSRYGLVMRFIAKRIVRRMGYDADASRDWEYTDWDAVARFAEEYLAAVDWAVAPFAAA